MVDNRHNTNEEPPHEQAEEARLAESAHVPAPSFWPVVLALTLTLAVAGLLIHPVVAVLGGVASFAAIVAWGLEGGRR